MEGWEDLQRESVGGVKGIHKNEKVLKSHCEWEKSTLEKGNVLLKTRALWASNLGI